MRPDKRRSWSDVSPAVWVLLALGLAVLLWAYATGRLEGTAMERAVEGTGEFVEGVSRSGR